MTESNRESDALPGHVETIAVPNVHRFDEVSLAAYLRDRLDGFGAKLGAGCDRRRLASRQQHHQHPTGICSHHHGQTASWAEGSRLARARQSPRPKR